MLLRLLWKEWRTYFWVLTVLIPLWTFFLWGLPPMAAQTGLTLLVPSLMLAIVAAAQTVAGERAGHTYGTLAVLPVPGVLVAAVKVFFGIVVLSITVFFANIGTSMSLGSHWSDSLRGFHAALTMTMGSALITYLWVILIAVPCTTRGAVSILGAGVLLVGYLALIPMESPRTTNGPVPAPLAVYLQFLNPVVLPNEWENYVIVDGWHYLTALAVGRTLVGTLLCVLAVFRLQRSDSAIPIQSDIPARNRHLHPPRKHWTVSLLFWKAFREVVGPAIAAILIDLAASLMLLPFIGDTQLGWGSIGVLASYAALAAGLWYAIGAVLMIALALRLAVPDRQRAMEAFWRSRPISPGLLFWSKYVAGIGVPVIVSASAYFVINLALGDERGTFALSMLFLLFVQLMIYNTAFLCATIFRNGFAAVVATTVLTLVFLAGYFFVILLVLSTLEDSWWIALLICGLLPPILAALFWLAPLRSLRLRTPAPS
jgi:hypothetical protein